MTTLVTGNCGSSATEVALFLGRIRETPLAVHLALSSRTAPSAESLKLRERAPLRKAAAVWRRSSRQGGCATARSASPPASSTSRNLREDGRGWRRLATRRPRHGASTPRMRSEGERVQEAIAEAIQIGESAGMPVEISHFKISSKRSGAERRDHRPGAAARARGLRCGRSVRLHGQLDFARLRFSSWLLEGGREEGRSGGRPGRARGVVREMKDALKRGGRKIIPTPTSATYARSPEYNARTSRDHEARPRQEGTRPRISINPRDVRGGRGRHDLHSMDDARRAGDSCREPFHHDRLGRGGAPPRRGRAAQPLGMGNNARVLGPYVAS